MSTLESSYSAIISELPDDLLLRIFSYLDAISLCKVRRVCQAWNSLSTDEILWKHKLMADVKSWKHISSSFSEEMDVSKLDLYLKNSPEIQTWKRNFYKRTTLHQLTDILRSFMPVKRYAFGVGASAMDSFGKGQSFFSKLLSFDAGNIFQHCGEFPGRFRGLGGGFQFKYKRVMLELCLMYVAPKTLRDAMTVEQKLAELKSKMENKGYLQLMTSLKGYIHTIDTRVKEGDTEESTIERLQLEQSEEVKLLNQHLTPGTPIIILSIRKQESDPYISSYNVSKSLGLDLLKRPWMVSECSAEMIYRDIEGPMDWLVSSAS